MFRSHRFSCQPLLYHVHTITLNDYIPAFGQFQHCPGEANDTPDNSKQHCSKDNRLLVTDSPSQPFVLKQTGATYANQ